MRKRILAEEEEEENFLNENTFSNEQALLSFEQQLLESNAHTSYSGTLDTV